MIDSTHRRAFRDLTFEAGWRVLSFRQTVNAIVEQDVVNIQIASNDVDKMVATNAQCVKVFVVIVAVEALSALNEQNDARYIRLAKRFSVENEHDGP